MNDIDKTNKSFEDIKHIDKNGVEFWYARELMPILQYSNWQNFEKIIDKAKISCENSGTSVFEHFIDVNKLSKRANNAEVEIKDYKLTRYACYLIAQNANPRLKRDKVDTEKKACVTHNKIGKIVRKAIKEAGGTMPEELPTPKKSLKQLEKENKKIDTRVNKIKL